MTIETDKGQVEGTTEEGIHVFKGIPYAAPPLGDRRWRAPQAVDDWKGRVLECTEFKKACPQPAYEDSLEGFEPVGEQDEDCLYLNVWTSGVDASALKPVMVWIHGGAFKIGAGHLTQFSGAPLAEKGAVVVTFNYRLGNLGFFAHPLLEAESGGTGPVNFGLLDQIAALQWVQNNIANFGGDPNNVTIFGQSAGGVSVLALFASPLAAGLFHKGIAQSPYAIPEHNRENAIAVGTNVATSLFKLPPDATVTDLRNVDVAFFSAKEMDGPDGAPVPVGGLAPVPVVDDVVLTKRIRASFKAGEQKVLPLIIGSTSNESSILAAFKMDPGDLMADIIEAGGEDMENAIEGIKLLYKNDPEVQPGDLDDPDRFASLVLRDILFTMQARWISDHHSKKKESWRYYFSYVTEADRPDHPHGVAHGNDIIHTMGTGDIFVNSKDTFTDNDRAMSDKVTAYWFSFANTATPVGTVTWTKNQFASPWIAVSDKDNTLKLGEEVADIKVQKNFRRVRLNQFIAIYPKLEAKLTGEPPEKTEEEPEEVPADA